MPPPDVLSGEGWSLEFVFLKIQSPNDALDQLVLFKHGC